MKYPVSRIPLPVLITLPALLWLLISAATTTTLYPEVIVTTPADPIHLPTSGHVDTPLDVDGDGSTDFIFAHRPRWEMLLYPTTGGRMILTSTYQFGPCSCAWPLGPTPTYSFPLDAIVTPLPPQFQIGPILPLSGIRWGGPTIISIIPEYEPSPPSWGHFPGLGGYIGIEFPIDGAPHYGWIRYDHFDINPGGSILEWAFESEPGVPIRTPNKRILVPMAAPKLTPGGYLRLQWPTRHGIVYHLHCKPRIDAAMTFNILIVPDTGSHTTLDMPMNLGPTQFFRVILPAIPVPLRSIYGRDAP